MPKVKVSDIQMYYEEMGDPDREPLLVTSGSREDRDCH